MEKVDIGDFNKFGAFVRATRESLGLSLRSVAASIGIDASYLSSVERGMRRPPAPKTVLKIAKFYKLDEDDTVDLLHMADKEHVGISREKTRFIRENIQVNFLIERLMKLAATKSETAFEFMLGTINGALHLQLKGGKR
jgi:transcriptional regulator with XRE-family HTH domain